MENQLSVREMAAMPAVVERFSTALGGVEKAKPYLAAVVSTVAANPALMRCQPASVLGAAMTSAALQLSVLPSLGHAYIIPYGQQAQFQLGIRGLVQLCQRSGEFRTMGSTPVYAGEIVRADRFNDVYEFDESRRTSEEVVGYYAHFELVNGFTKAVYWTRHQVEEHVRRYSKSAGRGPWQTNFDAMACNTVLKSILRRYAPMSIQAAMGSEYQSQRIDPETGEVYAFSPEQQAQDIGASAIERVQTADVVEVKEGGAA